MPPSGIMRVLLGAAFAVLVPAGAPVAASPSATAAPAPQTVQVVTYDASGAAEFREVVHRAARIWNGSVRNVELEPAAGSGADVTVVADDGWPRARPTGLGSGKIWMGREAVDRGHDPTRIAAHEIGHILGLPDRRTGVCGELMSGHSAGTGCANAHPSAQEAAEVERNFAQSAVVPRRLFVDSLPAVQPLGR